jgi:hypothetical protein
MTDSTPHDPPSGDELGPDDDGVRDLGALRELGFDTLSAGDAPFDGLHEVKARAERSTRRRRWALGAAAAAVLLVLGSFGVLLAGTGEESAPDVYTGPPAAGGEHFLLPPSDATDVGWRLGLDSVYESSSDLPPTEDVDFYRFEYTRSDGLRVPFFLQRVSDAGAGSEVRAGDGTSSEPTPSVIDTERFGWVEVVCLAQLDAATGRISYEWEFSLILGGHPEELTRTMCAPAEVDAMVAALDDLRVVDESEWRQYLEDHGDTNTLDPSRRSTDTTVAAGQ